MDIKKIMSGIFDRPYVETAKFVIRLVLLIFAPQLLAFAVDNSGALWADILSVTLPIVDKWVHESDSKINGIVPF